MSSILRYRGFTNLIYLVSSDRQRTNFPVNASEAYNAHDSFAVSAMKERDVVVGHHHHTPFLIMHERCFPSIQTFSLNAHSLCNPVLTIAYFPTEAFLTSYKFLGVAVCEVFPILVIIHQHLMYRSSRLNTKVLQQSHTTRGTGTCEAPGPCQAGTRDLCYLRRSFLIVIIIAVSW